ncbi:MAG: nucleotidyltransferase domain-containing protein [Planctomycetota bacterium]
MNKQQIGEVWAMLDRERLAGVAMRGPEPVFATISGAHLYGFASPDSDIDLRGAFLTPAAEVLGLNPPPETISIDEKTDIELDWVAHDLRKFARLMTKHNGYCLEQLYSPLVVVTNPIHEELMELGKGCITRLTARHCLGFANSRFKRLSEPNPTVKHLLYAYRVLLTGIRLMKTGEVVANIEVLNQEFNLSQINELVERKRTGAEKMPLAESELDIHITELHALVEQLNKAQAESSLPDEPQTIDELNEFVVRVRLNR